MTLVKFIVGIGIISLLTGCISNLTIQMYPDTQFAQTDLLADVKVIDLRKPGVAASKREAAFGTPMGTIEFNPHEDQVVKQVLEVELTKLLRDRGVSVKRVYSCDLIEFGVNTNTTPLYWDVIGRIHLVLNQGEKHYDFIGSESERTFIWPSEVMVKRVVAKSLSQITAGLKQVIEDK